VSESLTEAYAVCDQVTKTQARNFYYGIRLLPPQKRQVLCAVYALSRRIDDIGDGDLPAAEKLAALDAVRTSLADGDGDVVMLAVHDAARRFPIPLTAFEELLDGVQMDVVGRRYTSFDDLVTYCRCVAGSVGRLCLGVFGSRSHADAVRYADALGIALQQTNILRDVREDLLNGRVYLAQDDLDRFGVELRVDDRGRLVDDDGALAALIRFNAQRAREWYAEGLQLVPLLDRRSAACTTAMSGIYRRMLETIAARPSLVYDRRLSLSGWRKAGVAARALSGRAA
jgi:15-cis-phytoene synthase